MPLGGCATPSRRASFSNRSRSSAMSIASGEVPRIGIPAASSDLVSCSGVFGALPARDLEDVLERERLEVQLVRDVKVGRDGLGVRVDHDRLEAQLAERQPRAHAAVIELHTLADPVRAAAEDDDALLAERLGLVLFVVGRVEIGRRRRELAGAGVHGLVDGMNPEAPTLLANRRLGRLAQLGQLAVGESQPLHPLELRGGDLPERGEGALGIDQLTQLIEEPGVDA